jgi:serine O-acetyltransferase
MISPTEPDWSREQCAWGEWDPARRLLRAIRRFQKWQGRWGALGKLICIWSVLEHRFWSIVCSADIPINARLGGGLLLTHPNGVVIHPDSSIGPNCLIFHQVTIGIGSIPGLPRIGGAVNIGAGAKILGGVVIGDHAKIGANAVVLCDVPAGATAVGVPARVANNNSLRLRQV